MREPEHIPVVPSSDPAPEAIIRFPVSEEEALLHLAAIIESSGDAIFSKSLDGIITSWNPAAERMYGYRAEETVGRHVSIIVPPDRARELQGIFERLRRGERIEHFETERVCKDGSRLNVSVTISPMRDRKGALIGASTIARDITEQRRTQSLLRESEERFRATFEQAAVGIAHVDFRGNWIRVNQRLCDIVGYAREELLGLSFPSILLPEDRETNIKLFRSLLKDPQTAYAREKRYRRKDGAICWANITISLVRDAQGRPQYCLGVVEDISARKLAEAEVEALNMRLRRAMAETHHRVKNSLQTIAALVDVQTLDGAKSIPAVEFRRLGQIVRTLASIHDLLTQEAKHDADVNALPSVKTLTSLMEMMKSITPNHRLSWRIDDVPLPVRILTPLTIIINELVSNAAKHGRSEIRMDFTVRESIVELNLCDDGPGFPAEFDPACSKHTGLDLVMNLSRWDLGGEVRFLNRPEGGACVLMRMPLPLLE